MNIICFNCGFVQKPDVRLIDRCLECGSSDLIEGDGQELDLSGVTNQLLIDKESLSEENKSLKIRIEELENGIRKMKNHQSSMGSSFNKWYEEIQEIGSNVLNSKKGD